MNTLSSFTVLLSLTAILRPALAQQMVAPTPEQVGPARGDELGGYKIINSFETGYRFRTAGGDLGKYRSDVNFGNGIRLLGSFLAINSKDGHGRFFDEIVLTTQGLGNDPYEFASLRVQKNRLYRYDLLWRANDYYNPALTIANGQHLIDTRHYLQDHDLTLLPQSNVKFFLGYSRSSQNGPALSTIQLFDSRGAEFPLFSDIHRERNEYRVGGEIQAVGVKLNWLRGWDDFKEDTAYDIHDPIGPPVPNNRTALTSFSRRQPYHGTSPYWRVGFFSESNHRFAVNGRFTYVAGSRDFVLDESALGMNRFGAGLNRQIVTFGNARRPALAANLTLSFFATPSLTLTNHTSFNQTRMEGNSSFLQVDNARLAFTSLNFQFLGIRTVSNTTDLNYSIRPWLNLTAGYHYAERRIRSVELTAFPVQPGSLFEQTNHLNAGLFGVRVKPAKPFTITFDAEIGRADRPFNPVSEGNYHALGGRAQYKMKSLLLSVNARSNYNFNSASLAAYSSQSRSYSADAAWAPLDWISLDASYSKLHLNTAGGILYFLNSQRVEGDRSFYISNVHAANLGLRFGIAKRADLYAGYSRVQDAGDGRSDPAGPNIGSSLLALQAAQTFPLSFQSPLARFSLRINDKIRWNLGYQYYGYREEFFTHQNYRAHTGYSSVLWAF